MSVAAVMHGMGFGDGEGGPSAVARDERDKSERGRALYRWHTHSAGRAVCTATVSSAAQHTLRRTLLRPCRTAAAVPSSSFPSSPALQAGRGGGTYRAGRPKTSSKVPRGVDADASGARDALCEAARACDDLRLCKARCVHCSEECATK